MTSEDFEAVEHVDPAAMAEYERSMREEVIPKIEAEQRRQALMANCLRHHPLGCRCSWRVRP